MGLLAGAGLYLASPPTYQASTTLLLTVGPEAQPGTAILDDQTMAALQAFQDNNALPVQQLCDGKTWAAPYSSYDKR